MVMMWERKKESIIGRLTTLEDALGALKQDSLEKDLRKRAEREAHNLVGLIGTMGFEEGSRVARVIEHMLMEEAQLSEAEAPKLEELIEALRRELDHPPSL